MDSKLTKKEWQKIRIEYVKGNTTCKKLAEKYKISESTIRKHASKEGWRKKRNILDTKVEQKTLLRVCDARAKEFELIAQCNDQMSEVLKNIVDFIKEQPGPTYDQLRGVENLSNAIARVLDIKRDLYNIPTEVDKARIEALREKAKVDRARLNLERKKYRDELAEKAAAVKAAEGTMIRVEIEGDEEKGEMDE